MLLLHSMLRPFDLDVIRGCKTMQQYIATTMQQNEHVHFVASLLQVRMACCTVVFVWPLNAIFEAAVLHTK